LTKSNHTWYDKGYHKAYLILSWLVVVFLIPLFTSIIFIHLGNIFEAIFSWLMLASVILIAFLLEMDIQKYKKSLLISK